MNLKVEYTVSSQRLKTLRLNPIKTWKQQVTWRQRLRWVLKIKAEHDGWSQKQIRQKPTIVGCKSSNSLWHTVSFVIALSAVTVQYYFVNFRICIRWLLLKQELQLNPSLQLPLQKSKSIIAIILLFKNLNFMDNRILTSVCRLNGTVATLPAWVLGGMGSRVQSQARASRGSFPL